jgi:hypothetical protein
LIDPPAPELSPTLSPDPELGKNFSAAEKGQRSKGGDFVKRVFLTDDYCHQLVLRRLCALDYATDDLSGNPSGYIADDAGTAAAFGDTSGMYANTPPLPTPAGAAPTPSGSGNSSWISGIAGLFGAIGTTYTNVTKATARPYINPQTGLPYPVNPKTGLPYASSTSQSSIMLIVVVAVVLWLVFKG